MSEVDDKKQWGAIADSTLESVMKKINKSLFEKYGVNYASKFIEELEKNGNPSPKI